MKFWDSSAITPLLVMEADSAQREEILLTDGLMCVWYGTLVEIESALCRRLRENPRWTAEAAVAREKLRYLSNSWVEVEPTHEVRDRAMRLLQVHTLRAADALQLAAALVVFSEQTVGRSFLTGDLRLRTAALTEGFTVE